MNQANAKKNYYFCTNCGRKNPYPSNLSNFLLEGDYSVIQRADRAPKSKRYGLYCKYCGHMNPVDI